MGEFLAVLEDIEAGVYGELESGFYQQILDALVGEEGAHYLPKDFYLLGSDFPSFVKAQKDVDALYKDQTEWTKRSILSTAGMGKFSTDRTIAEYAEEIWGVGP